MIRPVNIQEYSDAWPEEFQRLAAAVRSVAPDGASLHHIGSTAVPGLGGKDVIDMQLSVNRLTDLAPEALERIGYVGGEHLPDHCPDGLTLPAEELAKFFFRHGGRPAHLHVRERGRFNQRYPVLCRDYLRAHPEAARAYQAFKSRLADHLGWRPDLYCAVKDPVFDILMTAANEWANMTGWMFPEED